MKRFAKSVSPCSKSLPKTGEASGQHMVMNRTLGTVIVRESELDPPPEKLRSFRSIPEIRGGARVGPMIDTKGMISSPIC